MKKLFWVLLLIAFAISACACTQFFNSEETTEPPLYNDITSVTDEATNRPDNSVTAADTTRTSIVVNPISTSVTTKTSSPAVIVIQTIAPYITTAAIAVTEAPGTVAPPQTTTSPVTTARPMSSLTVVIDPGHGFTDPGATVKLNGKAIYESDLNMQIALKLEKSLNLLGYNVIFTHDGKTNPAGSGMYNATMRCNDIIKLNKTTKISAVAVIHCNSNNDSSSNGTWLLRETSDKTGSVSYKLTEAVRKVFVASDYIKAENFSRKQDLALPKTGLPTVYVESGFMTNSSDLANLMSDEWQQILADAIAKGIDNYIISTANS